MKLCKLLSIHENNKSNSKENEILFDGYLKKENFIYRNICQASQKLGYIYVPAWPNYLMSPLTELDVITKNKTIPYIDIIPTLEKIEESNPNEFSLEQLPLAIELRHLHESAHVVADSFFSEMKINNENENILKIYMCESFASTCESVAVRIAFTKEHRTIMNLHSYITEAEGERFAKDRLIHNIGLEKTFVLIFYSYLFSNFLYKQIDEKNMIKILKDIDPNLHFTKKIIKDCLIVFRSGFSLSEQFRLTTNMFFMKNEGYKKDFFKLLNFDFMKILKHNPELNAIPWKMSKVAFDGLDDQLFKVITKSNLLQTA